MFVSHYFRQYSRSPSQLSQLTSTILTHRLLKQSRFRKHQLCTMRVKFVCECVIYFFLSVLSIFLNTLRDRKAVVTYMCF